MRIIIFFITFLSIISFQNSKALIITSVPDITSCPNQLLIVPVIVENLENVSWITLHLNYNVLNGAAVPGVLSFVGFKNMHPALNNGMLVNNSGNTVIMSWYTQTYLINIPHDTLVELKFNYSGGTTDLNWVTGGTSFYWGYSCGGLPSSFVNGSVDLTAPAPAIVSQPHDSTVFSSEGCSFSIVAANAVSYQWKLSFTGGITWVNIADTGYYSGSGTNELLISEAKMYMNNYYYRCYVTGACTPYQYSNPVLLNVIPQVKAKVESINTCPGELLVPVNIADFLGVAEFSIEIDYDNTLLSYDSYLNPNPLLSAGVLNVVDSSGSLTISWISATPQNISEDTLLELRFNSITSDTTCMLSWNTSVPGLCYFRDALSNDIASAYTDGIIGIVVCSDIAGKVYYHNIFASELAGVEVSLSRNGSVINTAISDASGNFSFARVHNDTYILSASRNGVWEGINSADAMMISRHFVGLDTLAGLNLIAADVDSTTYVNTTDALIVAQRFVGIITSFPVGDMVFDLDTLILNDTTTVNVDLRGLFSGDVNASYFPWQLPLIFNNKKFLKPQN